MQIETYVLSGVKHFVIRLNEEGVSFEISAIYDVEAAQVFFADWASEMLRKQQYVEKMYRDFGAGSILFHKKEGVESLNNLFRFFLDEAILNLSHLAILFVWITEVLSKPSGIYNLITEEL